MSVPWSGQGPSSGPAGRPASAGEGGTWTSALSTGEFAAIRSVGFEPVGQVMGSAVFHIGRSGRNWGYEDCRFPGARLSYAYGPMGGVAEIALSGNGAPSQALVGVFDEARRTALARMTAECRALGGDGVVSAVLTMAPFVGQANCLEFKVIGTAVRARGGRHVDEPFTCHLDGEGFAKLLGAGWVPVALLVGMSVGVRHDDYRTASQTGSWRNAEVTGWSELVHAVRSDARQQLRSQGAHRGGDSIVMAASRLRVWSERCPRSGENEQEDRLAEATMIGTTIARFQVRQPPPRTLSVMPLGAPGVRQRRRLAAEYSVQGSHAGYRRPVKEAGEVDG